MNTWNLKDMDNRDDDGAPYEITGAPAELVGYVDQAVRSDLTASAAVKSFDQLVAAFTTENLRQVQELGPRFGLYVHGVETP